MSAELEGVLAELALLQKDADSLGEALAATYPDLTDAQRAACYSALLVAKLRAELKAKGSL